MPTGDVCPVCKSEFAGVEVKVLPTPGDRIRYICTVCGDYEITGSALVDASFRRLVDKPRQRSALAFALRHSLDIPSGGNGLSVLSTSTLDHFERNGVALPDPLEQADRLIQYVGEHERHSGYPLEQMPQQSYAMIGAINPSAMFQILKDLNEQGFVETKNVSAKGSFGMSNIRLTLKGWRVWKGLNKGEGDAGYGFVAMQFGDEILDDLFNSYIKPGLKAALGIEIRRVDAPEVARAGIIDNIMRDEIRRAAFILADLTHGNKGAYWEAGYAEGLGKPVIYLCDKSVFEDQKTHFDVNHSTTVLWDAAQPDEVVGQLVATVRNSLSRRI